MLRVDTGSRSPFSDSEGIHEGLRQGSFLDNFRRSSRPCERDNEIVEGCVSDRIGGTSDGITKAPLSYPSKSPLPLDQPIKGHRRQHHHGGTPAASKTLMACGMTDVSVATCHRGSRRRRVQGGDCGTRPSRTSCAGGGPEWSC